LAAISIASPYATKKKKSFVLDTNVLLHEPATTLYFPGDGHAAQG
jgi:hypothetical protein